MARTSDPHSATSQFFINVNDNKSLNFRSPDPGGIGYTAFGKVVSGMDVVNKIAKTPKGKPVPPGVPISPNDLPKDTIVITKATVVETAAAPAK
jgi:peptidyl-prolyl cis-trans isomerase B (cyclophilin B)